MTYRNPINCSDYESALDNGQLFAAMRNGKWWQLRRNGKTQHWVRTPDRFRIPVKAGLRSCHAITELDDVTNYRIATSREEAEAC